MSTGDLAALNGWVPSPNDAWHQDVSGSPVDPNSATIVSAAQDLNGAYLHPDFSTPADGAAGIPYTVVDTSKNPIPLVSLSASDPGDSDNTLYPFYSSMPIEGNPAQCWTDGGDHHAIVIDKNGCVSYEVYQANLCNGSWTSYGNVIWDLTTTEQRPYGTSSVDAAGLSVFEGLIRYDEIVAGAINHAIRFTAYHTKEDNALGYFTAPAVHAAGNLWGTDDIMGMRIRLKANVDISGFSSTNQIILTAMKKYGMILADNGGNMFFQGTPDSRWNDNDLNNLKSIPSTDFEVVQMGAVYDENTAPAGPAPVINSFTASSSTVTSGSSVTLTSNVTNGSYQFIDNAGFTRGSITVNPTATTIYTLYARNQYGTSTASTTVTVSAAAAATPTLGFTAIGAQTYGVSPFAVSASSNSPGAITYSVVSGPATIAGNVVSLTGVGTVTIKASQAASGSYNATTATTSFVVNAETPTITFASIGSKTTTAGPFTVSATSNSSAAITYAVVSGPGSISGNTVTLSGTAGTVTLIASQAATGNFGAGTETTSFAVTAASTTPTITFASIGSKTTTAGPFTVSATSNSSAAITYAVASGPASISGNTVTLSGTAGTVTLIASQAATGNFAAGTATTSFTVTAASSTTPTLSFVSIPAQTYGASLTVSAKSNSAGAITYAVTSGPATISGSTVTITGTGTVSLKAAQAASGNYTAAIATTSFAANPATPTLTISPIASVTVGASPITVSAGSNSTGAIKYAVASGPATISGNVVTVTGAGTVTISASQAASTDYTAATATASFTVSAAAGGRPNLTVSVVQSKTGWVVVGSSNSPGAIVFAIVSGPARMTSSNTLVVTGTGTVTVKALQAASGNFTSATAATTFN